MQTRHDALGLVDTPRPVDDAVSSMLSVVAADAYERLALERLLTTAGFDVDIHCSTLVWAGAIPTSNGPPKRRRACCLSQEATSHGNEC